MSETIKYPINYDFGKNWETKIVPHLSKPIIKKAIRKGVNKYLSHWPDGKKYKANTAPASYSSKDGYACGIMNRQRKIKMKELKKNNLLSKELLDLKKLRDSYTKDDIDLFWNDYGQEVVDAKGRLLKPYFSWIAIKDRLETYYLSGGCYSWAPTFELELARLVEPNENWHVRKSKKHATVINDTETKVFDLLYWIGDWQRLNNYLFGDPFTETDLTLGGKDAYLDSA